MVAEGDYQLQMVSALLLLIAMLLLALAARSCSSFVLHHPRSSSRHHSSVSNIHHTLSIQKLMMSSTSPSSTDPQDITKRIFCYGDSLSAGTSPPYDQLFPYGPHLEKELNENLYKSNNKSVVVRWRGLPGWTSSAMVEYINDTNFGLQPVLDGISNPSLSLVIILAGTNDIGGLTSSMTSNTDNNVDVSLAVEPIIKLHQECLNCIDTDTNTGSNQNIHTLAIGIPSSAWQIMNPTAARLCNDMNIALQNFAKEHEERVTYVDFPFDYEQGGVNWSGDGLHFSPEGYETLGRSLAPYVKKILDGM